MCIMISKVGDMNQSVRNGDPNMTIDKLGPKKKKNKSDFFWSVHLSGA